MAYLNNISQQQFLLLNFLLQHNASGWQSKITLHPLGSANCDHNIAMGTYTSSCTRFYVDWLSGMGKLTPFSQKYYCAFTHPIFKIKLSRTTWLCIAGSIVLVKNLILLKLNFAKFEICYILTIGAENDDSFWAQECITIGLYVIRSSWELWSALPEAWWPQELQTHCQHNSETYTFTQQMLSATLIC